MHRPQHVVDSFTMLEGSAQPQLLLKQLTEVAPTDTEILIVGPKQISKQVYAEYTHRHSRRSDAAFVSVNCVTIPDHLLELKLFGREESAGDGARLFVEGAVATAEGGTLFFDGLDNWSLPSQMKLLRFVQDKEYRCLGGTHLRRANVRIMA